MSAEVEFVDTDTGEPGGLTWTELRAITLYRAGYRCELCGTRPATEADHVLPRALGGRDELSNLQAACSSCNKAKADKLKIQQLSWDQLVTAEHALSRRIERLQRERSLVHDSMDRFRPYMEGTNRSVAEALRAMQADAA